jgi:2-phosphosulfolactate phosphatase
MRIDVLLTPREVRAERLAARSVVVFDVLRATTTMTAALAAGVAEIRVFDSLDAAVAAAKSCGSSPLLCGERNCLPPPGFDLGNSPGSFTHELHAGRTVCMATTNGTRAIVAARSAKLLLIGALVNASAVARRLVEADADTTLLCAGTDGEPAMEDVLGAGAVMDALGRLSSVELEGDVARIALRLFQSCRENVRSAMADAIGGRNVSAVGLGADIDFAARLDVFDIAGRVDSKTLIITPG